MGRRVLVLPRAQFTVLALALTTLTGASTALAQTAPPPFPTFYFDSFGYTETWIDQTPPPAGSDAASPITLNLNVRYRGRPVPGALQASPLAIIVRAESNPQYNPMFLRQPILQMDADDEALWDPGLKVNFYTRNAPACEGCSSSADIVDAEVPEDAVRRMASARRLSGNAMGMPFRLTLEQIAQIGAFVDYVFGPR
jgi:hypothetical protein